MNEKHDKADSAAINDNGLHDLEQENELMEEAKKEQDLYEALYNDLNSFAEGLDNPNKVEELKETVKRFQSAMEKKTELQVAATKEIKRLKHEVKLSAQVEAKQSRELDEKDLERVKLTKQIKEGNEKLKEKDKMIKQLTEALGAEENDEVEIQIVQQTNRMNKESTGHPCNACDKTFRQDKDLEKHMEAKHTEKHCTYCDKNVTNEQELVQHMKECVDFGVKTTLCNKCKKNFTNFGLKRHMNSCQGKPEFDCPECGQVFNSPVHVKSHYDSVHKWEDVQAREVCKWWRKGNCNNKKCKYAHVGHQNKNSSESQSTSRTRVPACRNGQNCDWMKKGRCSYFHINVGIQKPWSTVDRRQENGVQAREPNSFPRKRDDARQHSKQHNRQQHRQGGGKQPRLDGQHQHEQSRQLKQCKFGDRCDKGMNCGFLHLAKDFLPLQSGRRN